MIDGAFTGDVRATWLFRRVKLVGFACSMLGALFAGGQPEEARAQSSLPDFGACDDTMYLMQGLPTTLTAFDTSTNPIIFDTIGSGSRNYNSASYNPADNYIYGLDGEDLIRVGSDGSTEQVTTLSGIGTFWLSGDIGADGYKYVKRGGNNTDFVRIDLDTLTTTSIPLSQVIGLADMAWHNGRLYAHNNIDNNLIAIDPDTGDVEVIGPTGIPGLVGAMFGASNGVFGSHNNGGFFSFNVETGAATRLAGSPGSGLNDGAKCYSTPVVLASDIELEKTSAASAVIPGTDVIFTITLRSNGPFGASGAVLDDPLPAGITNASWTCSAGSGASCGNASGTGAIAGEVVDLPDDGTPITYTMTMSVPADFTGDLVNTATISAATSGPDPDNTNNEETVTLPSAGIQLEKTATLNDANGNSLPDPGETLDYVFTVSNTGDVALSNISISDPLVAVPGTIAGLAPGASDSSLSASYTLTVADLNNGEISNQATVTAETPDGGTLEDLSDDPDEPADTDAEADGEPDDPTVVTLDTSAMADFVKAAALNDANGNTYADAGETIDYSFTVTNTGNVTLSDITVADNQAAVTGGPIVSLAPGVSDSTTFTGSYTITEADIDGGTFSNQATATAYDPDGAEITIDSHPPGGAGLTVFTFDQNPAMELVKEVTFNDENGNSYADAGETFTYSFTVTNTGNVTLSNITLDDADVPVTGGPIASLAPGASDSTTFSASYTLTIADINAGTFENQASGTGYDPNGDPVTVTSNPPGGTGPTVFAFDQSPDMELVKEVSFNDENGNSFADVGETFTYSFTVTNTGNVTLSNITVDDDQATVTGGPIASLDPGVSDSTTFTGSYTITAADIDSGSFENQASATGYDPNGDPVTVDSNPPGGSGPTVFEFTQNPAMELIKEVSFNDENGNTFADVGETLSYSFTVTNTGNVTLSNITVDDDQATVTGGPVDLAPGEEDSTTFAGSYTITAADIDSGSFENQASATGYDPNGDPVTVDSNPPDGTGPTVFEFDQNPAMELVKEVSFNDENGNSYADVGETFTYGFTVTNTGNVTLSDIAVEDDKAIVAGGPLDLAPGVSDSTTFTGSYTITAADIDSGSFENQASGTGYDPNGEPVTVASNPPGGTGPTVFEFEQNPAMELVKEVSFNDENGNTFADVGETFTYSFTVANTGNVTLSDITVDDDQATVTGGPIDLAPGEEDSTTFAGSYTITVADINDGSFENQASGTGYDPNGDPVTVSSNPPGGTGPTVFEFDQNPAMELVKGVIFNDENGNTFADVGETFTYSFSVTNTGNVTLSNITVDDDQAMVTGGPIALLDPGEKDSTTFAGSHTISAAEIDSGSFENQATATGYDPNGDPVTVNSNPPDGNGPTIFELVRNPAIRVEMNGGFNDVNDNGLADAGETVDYTIKVSNTGNVTLENIVVAGVEALDSPSAATTMAAGPSRPVVAVSGGPLASLPAGTSDDGTFTASHVLTQEDIDAGELQAQVEVSASAPDDTQVADLSDDPEDSADTDVDDDADPDDPATTQLPQSGALLMLKGGEYNDLDGNGFAEAGEIISYTVVITNDGNVTLNKVVPDDPGPLFNGHQGTGTLSGFVPPSASLAPGEEATFIADYTMSQADVDHAVGVKNGVTNTARSSGAAPDGTEIISPPSQLLPDGEVSLPGVGIVKAAALDEVRRGEQVPFTITVSAVGMTPTANVVDTMPRGFSYVDGTARVAGEPWEPAIEGRTLTFEDVAITEEPVTITLALAPSGSVEVGKHVNRARVLDPASGRLLSQEATAVVEVVIDPLFDCGDIIGKVFDDLDRNGYQSRDEPGLAGVRVATVKGLVVGTDEHGRFHVPCAWLPDARIGSTFVMKLDTRSLPSGYRMTTENPRTVRLTAGKAARVNFGASVGRIVRLELTDEAFIRGSTELRPAWFQRLPHLVSTLEAEKSVLRIAYADTSADHRLAAQRVRQLRRTISEMWKNGPNRYRLSIEVKVIGQEVR